MQQQGSVLGDRPHGEQRGARAAAEVQHVLDVPVLLHEPFHSGTVEEHRQGQRVRVGVERGAQQPHGLVVPRERGVPAAAALELDHVHTGAWLRCERGGHGPHGAAPRDAHEIPVRHVLLEHLGARAPELVEQVLLGARGGDHACLRESVADAQLSPHL